MPISDEANDYLELWAKDLNVKEFADVKLVKTRLPYVQATRPDGKKLVGFAAFRPKDLDIKLWQGIEDAYEEGAVVFLVTPDYMMDSAENCLRVWNITGKVNLQGTMRAKED